MKTILRDLPGLALTLAILASACAQKKPIDKHEYPADLIEFKTEDGKTVLDGTDIVGATNGDDQPGFPVSILLEFNTPGAEKLKAVTEANVGKMITLYLRGRRISSGRIAEPITGGNLRFSGFTPEIQSYIIATLNNPDEPIPPPDND